MVRKKINKKGMTLTSMVVGLLVIIGMFSFAFIYLQSQLTNEGTQLPEKYNLTYNQLSSAQDTISSNIDEIQDNFENINEADNTFQVALNGLKGLGSTLKLPISFISSGVDTASALFISGDFIPEKARGLILAMIIAIIVFLVLANLKGEPKM